MPFFTMHSKINILWDGGVCDFCWNSILPVVVILTELSDLGHYSLYLYLSPSYHISVAKHHSQLTFIEQTIIYWEKNIYYIQI